MPAASVALVPVREDTDGTPAAGDGTGECERGPGVLDVGAAVLDTAMTTGVDADST